MASASSPPLGCRGDGSNLQASGKVQVRPVQAQAKLSAEPLKIKIENFDSVLLWVWGSQRDGVASCITGALKFQ